MYNKEEYEKELKMNYKELIAYLLSKYGMVSGNYFLTSTCKSKNRNITRTKDGLYIHHIAEDKYINIGQPEFAITISYDYQKADQLVYCNYFEHMLLHKCIVREADPRYILETQQNIGIGGLVNFLFPEATLFYSRSKELNSYDVDSQEWRKNCHMCLRNNYDIFYDIFGDCICELCAGAFGWFTYLDSIDSTLAKKLQKEWTKGKMVSEKLFTQIFEKLFTILMPNFLPEDLCIQ